MADASSVAACEQHWNELHLNQPPAVPAWRIWRYDTPTLVLGCSQRKLLAGAHAGLEVLPRRAGGGAVLVGPWMLGLSVALPSAHPRVVPSAVGSYRWLAELLERWLRAAGIRDARALAPGSPALQRGPAELDWACFGGLSPWELVADGQRKITGLAQVRRRDVVLLVAGTLLMTPDWKLLAASLDRPVSQAEALARRTTSWTDLLGQPPDTDQATAALDALLAEALDA